MAEIPQISGINIRSSNEILSKHTKLACLFWAPSGFGKTNLAGSLDRLTRECEGKRTLYIPVESAEGGGAATIRKLDVPMFVPKDYTDLHKTLGYIKNSKEYGGVVLDSASEFVKQHVKPAALKYPCRENVATRAVGVPTRSDYQVMGEMTSQIFRQLMLLTTNENPEYRKHLIITAADQSREEDERLVWMGPDLPGRMSREAVQMFQVVGTINIKGEQVAGKRVANRYLTCTADGVKALKDRFEVMPSEILLRKNLDDQNGGLDLCDIWQKYWIPAMN